MRFEGPVRQAIVEGFARMVSRSDPPILKRVTNPLTHERGHAGKDVPIVTFGCSTRPTTSTSPARRRRWEALDTFVYPSLETIENVLDTVLKAGSQVCPPFVVGVGIGGTFDHAERIAKDAVLRPFGLPQPEPVLAAMEARLHAGGRVERIE